ncbi:MAG: hypothetical protein M3N13_08205, partial [Candidatus Eremiobacteraeota bacterium]|nr:hypothetical protein [Candidatus Eremiobacteraeota bacterium]
MTVRFTAAVLAAAVASFACASPAYARPAVEHVAGKSIEDAAKPLVQKIRLSGDSALIQTSTVADQTVPAGAVSLVAQTPLETPSFVNVPIEL